MPAQALSPESSQASTIFVGDLSIYCTEQDLYTSFQRFGTIGAIRIKRGGPDKINLLYGFIKFTHRHQAESAIRAMKGFLLLGRAIRYDHLTFPILPAFYYHYLCCRTGWADGKSVTKKTERSQTYCNPSDFIPSFHPSVASKLKAPGEGYQARPLETAQIHVSFISKQVDFLVSESTLRELFGRFGEIVDVALKKTQFDQVRN
jgi:RNA recognition motif-containing protein